MKVFANLFAGRVALWCAFWLVGLPLFVVWNVSVGCLFAPCTVPMLGGTSSGDLLIAFPITLTSAGVLLNSVAIWRSATNYQGHEWWKTFFSIAAKAFAIMTGSGAFSVLSAVLYGLVHYAVTGKH